MEISTSPKGCRVCAFQDHKRNVTRVGKAIADARKMSHNLAKGAAKQMSCSHRRTSALLTRRKSGQLLGATCVVPRKRAAQMFSCTCCRRGKHRCSSREQCRCCPFEQHICLSCEQDKFSACGQHAVLKISSLAATHVRLGDNADGLPVNKAHFVPTDKMRCSQEEHLRCSQEQHAFEPGKKHMLSAHRTPVLLTEGKAALFKGNASVLFTRGTSVLPPGTTRIAPKKNICAVLPLGNNTCCSKDLRICSVCEQRRCCSCGQDRCSVWGPRVSLLVATHVGPGICVVPRNDMCRPQEDTTASQEERAVSQ